MQNCTDGMSDDAVKTMSRTNKKYLWQMKNRLFTHSSTEYCGESNEIVLFVFVTNVVIVNKQPGLHLCYVFTYQFHWSGSHDRQMLITLSQMGGFQRKTVIYGINSMLLSNYI